MKINNFFLFIVFFSFGLCVEYNDFDELEILEKVAYDESNNDLTGPLFRRSNTLLVSSNKSHLSSLICALFTIPSLQGKFFEEAEKELRNTETTIDEKLKNSFVTSTALYFAKMRLLTAVLPIKNEYQQLFRNIYPNANKLNARTVVLIDYYWMIVLKLLPDNILNMFIINYSIKKSINGSAKLLASAAFSSFLKEIELDGTVTILSQYMNNGALNNSAKQTQFRVGDRVYDYEVKHEITNVPQILSFRIKRYTVDGSGNVSFNNKMFIFNDKLKLPNIEEKFVLVSRIAFDILTGTYVTYARDYGNLKWYKYTCNGLVVPIETEVETIDNNSIWLFYVPESSLKMDSIPVPDVFYEILDIPKPVSYITGSKRCIDEVDDDCEEFIKDFSCDGNEDENDLEFQSIYIPKPDQVSNMDMTEYNSILQDISEKIKIWPIDHINCFAKAAFKSFPLGSEVYSFKSGPDGKTYTVLEFILSSLAVNAKAVEKLFERFMAPDSTEFEKKITLIVTLMLLGCKNISLDKVAFIIKENYLFDFFDYEQNAPYLFNQLMQIISLLNPGIIGIPKINVALYPDMTSEYHVLEYSGRPTHPVYPCELVDPKPDLVVNNNCVYFDYSEKTRKRRRDIYKSESEIFLLQVSRKKGQKFDKSALKYNIEGFTCYGVITSETVTNRNLYSFFTSDFNPNQYLKTIPDSQDSITFLDKTETEEENINEIISKKSFVLFFRNNSISNPSCSNTTNSAKTSSIIPKEIMLAAIEEYTSSSVSS